MRCLAARQSHSCIGRIALKMNRLQIYETEPGLLRLFRAIGAVCLIALVVLSLLPGDERPHTGAAGQAEHAVAYFGTAMFLAFAFQTMRGRVAIISLLIGMAAVLEVFQRLIPGRHSQLIDWLASSSGAVLGVLAVILIQRLLVTK
jgi:VanZ family protein